MHQFLIGLIPAYKYYFNSWNFVLQERWLWLRRFLFIKICQIL